MKVGGEGGKVLLFLFFPFCPFFRPPFVKHVVKFDLNCGENFRVLTRVSSGLRCEVGSQRLHSDRIDLNRYP